MESMNPKVFEGIKVADFSWAVAGPMVSGYLADHGATVVRIENPGRIDICRTVGPFHEGKPGLNTSMMYGRVNANKFGVSLDLAKSGGIELAWRLIEWADIVIESFRPGAMGRLGLDYESVRKVRPDIIYFSTSLLGQWGPYCEWAGYGQMVAALAGFAEITGWPGRLPGVPGAYVDYVAPHFSSACIIAALEFRRRTGKGQYIEQSQYESALQFLTPLLMDYLVNGKVAGRQGNRNELAAPHGAFPCQGDDRWIAIAVSSDAEWEAFCSVVDDPRLTAADYATFVMRKRNEDELERIVSDCTSRYSAEELEAKLQAARVPASMVEKCSDLFEDVQLKHRRYFSRLAHPEMGLRAFEAQACYLLSKTPRETTRPSPCLGEHNEYVYQELLGLSDDQFADHIANGDIPGDDAFLAVS